MSTVASTATEMPAGRGQTSSSARGFGNESSWMHVYAGFSLQSSKVKHLWIKHEARQQLDLSVLYLIFLMSPWRSDVVARENINRWSPGFLLGARIST